MINKIIGVSYAVNVRGYGDRGRKKVKETLELPSGEPLEALIEPDEALSRLRAKSDESIALEVAVVFFSFISRRKRGFLEAKEGEPDDS